MFSNDRSITADAYWPSQKPKDQGWGIKGQEESFSGLTPDPRPLTPKKREPRFGFRPPSDGSPPPYSIHLSWRWLLAGVLAAIGALAAALKLPRSWLPAAAGGMVALGAGAAGAAVLGAKQLRYECWELPISRLPPAFDGFRIVQLSDLHLGRAFTARNVRRAVQWAMQRKPDLIAITGDFAHHHIDPEQLRAAFAGLDAPHGMLSVFGNHDYWDDHAMLELVLNELGIEVLRNQRRVIQVDGAQISLVGIDCIWEARHDIELAMREVPPGETAIVLAHEPDIADDVAAAGGKLQLSGHNHGGHIALPILGPLFLPRHGLRYVRGLLRAGGMWLYVSRGLGGAPLRLGSPPEVTEITLKMMSDE